MLNSINLDVNYRDRIGNGNLHLAVKLNDIDWLRALIAAEANIDAVNNRK